MFNAALKILCTITLNALSSASSFLKDAAWNFYQVIYYRSLFTSYFFKLKILGDFCFLFENLEFFVWFLPQTKLCFPKWQIEFVKTNICIIFRWRKTPGRKTTPSYGTFQETECEFKGETSDIVCFYASALADSAAWNILDLVLKLVGVWEHLTRFSGLPLNFISLLLSTLIVTNIVETSQVTSSLITVSLWISGMVSILF